MRPLIWFYVLAFCAFYTVIGLWPGSALSLAMEFGLFFALGLLGALVANSTGAGGGVIFIPFFTVLGLTANESVATSMAIQCCGMTAGAIAWLTQYKVQPASFHCTPGVLKQLIVLAGISTIIGVLLAQYGLPPLNLGIEPLFRWFSLFFGVVLFVYTLATRNVQRHEQTRLSLMAAGSIVVTGLLGGMVTAWLSVGVGECLALLLFFLGFNAKLAVAVGVIASSISVLTGVVHHIVVTEAVRWEVFLFAGQAALIGGYLARHITLWLGGHKLKLFFAVWIFLSGVFIG